MAGHLEQKASGIYSFIKNLDPKMVWKRRVARRKMLAFYSQFITPGCLCFDVGANKGNRTGLFLHLGARVISIEPQQKCFALLQKKFKNKNVVLLQKALGDTPGKKEMMVSSADTISSLSEDWVKAVQKSGRFSDFSWDRRSTVEITTLDELIGTFGLPAFIKIDVEGYEYQVVRGLTKKVNCISIEFTPEYHQGTIDSIKHLAGIGEIHLNFSREETMRFHFPEWTTPGEMEKFIAENASRKDMTGDMYIKFI
jgi:FkbM family methyltransferase